MLRRFILIAVPLIFTTIIVIQRNRSILQLWIHRKHFHRKCEQPLSHQFNQLSKILLAINFNHPHYENIPILVSYFKPVFPNFVLCGPTEYKLGDEKVIKIDQAKSEYGFYGYQCAVEAIKRNPEYDGYLLVNDDMLVNWWNFLGLDFTEFWFGDKKPDAKDGYHFGSMPDTWFSILKRGKKCEQTYNEIVNSPEFNSSIIIETFMNNTGNMKVCLAAISDIFYVPKRHAHLFAKIGQKFYDSGTFLEVAVPMTLYFLENKADIVQLEGAYLQRKYGWGGQWKHDTINAWREYNYTLSFLHPYKFSGDKQRKKTREFEEKVALVSQVIISEKCLDVLTEEL